MFTTTNRPFTISLYLIGFIVIATGVANTLVAVFQCCPVAYEWNKSVQGGKCIDGVAFARYMTMSNVVTGAIMLVMPLPLSWRLNLTVSAKITLTATFLHGTMYADPDTHQLLQKTQLTIKQRIRRKLCPPNHPLPNRRIQLLKQYVSPSSSSSFFPPLPSLPQISKPSL